MMWEHLIGSRRPWDKAFPLTISGSSWSQTEAKHYLRCRDFGSIRLQELLSRPGDGQPSDVLEIATNDSDGYAFDLTVNRDTASYPIVQYPLGDLDRTDVQVCSDDLNDFLENIAFG